VSKFGGLIFDACENEGGKRSKGEEEKRRKGEEGRVSARQFLFLHFSSAPLL
jgi:hypothetical protein